MKNTKTCLLLLYITTTLINAPIFLCAQYNTSTIQEAVSHWSDSYVHTLSIEERQLLIHDLYFLAMQASTAYAITQYSIPFCDILYQTYDALTEDQHAIKYLAAVQEYCKKLIPLQEKLYAYGDAQKRAEACIEKSPEQYIGCQNAIDALRILGQDLALLLAKDLAKDINSLNDTVCTQAESIHSFFKQVPIMVETINQKCVTKKYDNIIRLYALRGVIARSVRSSWEMIGLHANSTALHNECIKFSAYIYFYAYKKVYETLDEKHKMIIPELKKTENYSFPAELPNPATFVA
ncbi:MAG TPA: hypothetical protein VGW78_01830 [Candidatus Babeliales bacterium]|jgi:hypothetical protein|nr:hypothetical protein [Candidatus Babeliales bacterium]